MNPRWIWSDKITNERVARVGCNHFISNKGEWNNCFSKFSNQVLPPIFISRSEVENFARKIFKLGALFSIANQKARNAIVGAENLLNMNSCISDESYEEKSDFIVAAVLIVDTVNKETTDENWT